MTNIKQSDWDISTYIDYSQFSSGETLTFVEATYDSLEQKNGFKFSIHGLLDSEGRFHVIGHKTELAEPDKKEI